MRLEIKTPSRLHLGLIDLNGNLGRLYGSVGAAIDYPNVVLEAEDSDRLIITGKEEALTKSIIKKISSFYGEDQKIKINVKEAIPRHVGLGSGTQLTLAVATAYCRIKKIRVNTEELAFILGRGNISGIGVAAYKKGGFIIDSGYNVFQKTNPKPVIHKPFPENWRFIVAVPDQKENFSGKKEENAFRNIIPGKQKIAEETSRLVLMKLIPSFFEEDINTFGSALTELDRKTGEYFSKAQKGIFSHNTTEKIISAMIQYGAYGAGQSSWGPTCYALTDKFSAENLLEHTKKYMAENKIKGTAYIAKPNNKGAETKTKK